ncbi:MAG: phosphate ABC transporter permease subunit PstC [Treponema sp.]|jgi:phosphate transport system permease protein|nr:phosphate ABC transporter permease subunit PstC [Treponema sp.]
MLDRRGADLFFKYLFRLVSLSSILALGAIVLFVFINGAEPFVFPTAPGIRLVTENIDEITVNGRVYRDHRSFIALPGDTASISLQINKLGTERSLEIALNDGEEPAFTSREGADLKAPKINSPEAYTYTISYPGKILGLEQKIHLILPEPPYGLLRFLGGLEWRPTYNKVYGIFPMILGTILAGFGAVVLGVPIALLSSVFMAEFLAPKPAALIRSGIELLAGIPSVVYGFFGLMVIVPAVKQIFHAPSGNSLLSAVIVLAVMILPTVIAISEVSIRSVPLSCREASLALGASKMQTAWRVVLPHARSGVIAGIILGISRAAGETMAVILVAGNSVQLIRSPLESIRTLTATVALEMGYAEGRHNGMLFSIGTVLFILILILNGVILWMRRRTEDPS